MIKWFTADGTPVDRPSVPGESLADFGSDPNGFNPFGMAFAPDGTLYFVDIHITCSGPLTNCGPSNYEGRVMSVTLRARSGTRSRRPRSPGTSPSRPASPSASRPDRSARSPTTRPRCRRPRVRPKGNDRVRPDRATAPAPGPSRQSWCHGRWWRRAARPGPRPLTKSTATTAPPASLPAGSWASYGNGPEHDFTGPTTLTPSTVGIAPGGVVLPHRGRGHRHPDGGRRRGLLRIVGHEVLRRRRGHGGVALVVPTGLPDRGHARTPGEQPRTDDSDGGLVTSTAWYEPGGGRPSESRHLRGRLHPLRHRRRHRTALLEARLRRPARAAPEPDHRSHPDLLVAHRRGRERLLRDEHRRAGGRARVHRGGQPPDG